MKFVATYKIPIGLSISAFIVTILALNVFNYFTFMYGPSVWIFIVIPLIAAANTFIFSSLGIRLLTKRKLVPSLAALWGFLLGGAAFFGAVFPTLFLTFHPSYYQRVLFTLISAAFVLGGFLAPIFGAAVGYWLRKNNSRTKTDRALPAL